MAKKEKDLLQSMQDFNDKLIKAKRRLVKTIDVEEKLSKETIKFLSEAEFIVDDRHWSINKKGEVLLLKDKKRYNNDLVMHSFDDKIEVCRGKDLSLVIVSQLGDHGFYTDNYILETSKEL